MAFDWGKVAEQSVSALIVACVVGVAWFLKKEYELWYEERKNANARRREAAEQLRALCSKMQEAAVTEREALIQALFTLLDRPEMSGQDFMDFHDEWGWVQTATVSGGLDDATWRRFFLHV